MKRVNLYLADGFEEMEAITVVDIMRRSGIDIKTISIADTIEVRGAHSIKVIADGLFEKANHMDADMIVLPGGMPGTLNLETHLGLRDILLDFSAKNKYIAAICAAPSILGKMGLLADREATCYPSFERHLKKAITLDDAVVQHGNIITSRGPGTAIDFALKLVEVLVDYETVEDLKESMIIR